MTHWMSRRGLWRGLRLSGWMAALWQCWAIGFTQGARHAMVRGGAVPAGQWAGEHVHPA